MSSVAIDASLYSENCIMGTQPRIMQCQLIKVSYFCNKYGEKKFLDILFHRRSMPGRIKVGR